VNARGAPASRPRIRTEGGCTAHYFTNRPTANSALSLARRAGSFWPGQPLRSADFLRHRQGVQYPPLDQPAEMARYARGESAVANEKSYLDIAIDGYDLAPIIIDDAAFLYQASNLKTFGRLPFLRSLSLAFSSWQFGNS
jgi:hypothetical protein